MKKKIIFFLFSFFSILIKQAWSDDIYQSIQPEKSSEVKIEKSLKSGTFKNFVVVTANDYATKIGYDILEKGGTVADAAVAIQLTLGLVEPQSSGLGGGIFLTYYNKKTNKTVSFDGREKAPKIFKENIFLNKDGNPKRFCRRDDRLAIGPKATRHAWRINRQRDGHSQSQQEQHDD